VLSYSKRAFLVLAGLAVLGGLALAGLAPGLAAAQSTASAAQDRTITVVGRGEVKVKPDVATTNLGVEVTAPTVSAAMEQAEERMNAVLVALKAAGIADKDIQTSNFSVSFERQTPEVTPRADDAVPAGVYRVSNMVQVTIRNLDAVGDIIDAAVATGANNVWGVSFGLENTEELEGQAREKAVANARARAESLAALNGVTVGNVIHISEIVGAAPGPVYAEAARASYGGGAPVEAGEVTFSTQIQIVYAMQ
jgi:uncharacterized protein YggE